jgi:hypothetical protein
VLARWDVNQDEAAFLGLLEPSRKEAAVFGWMRWCASVPWAAAAAVARVGLVLWSLSSTARAEIVWDFSDPTSVSVAQINQAGGLQVGDKVFADFSVASSGNAIYKPTAADITVSGLIANGDYGLQLNGGWFAQPGKTLDTAISFDVSVASSGAPNLIDDAALSMDGVALTALPDAFVQITESVYPSAPVPGVQQTSLVPGEIVYANWGGEPVNGVDEAFVENGVPVAFPEVWVVKDILLYGGTIPDLGPTPYSPNTAISWITQSYSQTPEPGSLVLLGIAAASLLAFAWRRRTKAS